MQPVALLAILSLALGLPAQERRIHTDRPAAKLLPLPKQDDCFHFAIFGDRTGGRPEGLKVLEQAIRDTNLLDPDLVMTVGDLINGYNQTPKWLAETKEFKAIMNRLKMPWFPVAGNHDTYGPRTDGKLFGIHAGDYEKHFGPLWYWFEHKESAFVVLYSDEGSATTGEVAFGKPELQKMSPKQLAWLKKALAANKDREHIFVFLHHPRWHKGNYGEDWDKVHAVLAAAGNVTAVFAGHIHHMVYAGKKDGIEYFTLGTTGGNLSTKYPEGAGYLHHLNIVTVRKAGISVSTIPVGAVLDPKLVTRELATDVRKLTNTTNGTADEPLKLGIEGATDGTYTAKLYNPTTRPVEFTLTPDCRDPRWSFIPDHAHVVVPPGADGVAIFSVARAKNTIDNWFALPRLRVQADYLAKGLRIATKERTVAMQVLPPQIATRAKTRGSMTLAKSAFLSLPSKKLELPDKTFTVEAMVHVSHLEGRRTVIHDPGFALYLSPGGTPTASVITDQGGLVVASPKKISAGTWHHLAAVYDGAKLRLYVDGALTGAGEHEGRLVRKGKVTTIGAGVGTKQKKNAFLWGRIDEVRISADARYTGKAIAPGTRQPGFDPDDATLLLLRFDRPFGPWTADASKQQAHPRRHGIAEWAPDPAPR